MHGTQIATEIICNRKKQNGTAMILLVPARKSAEASITSMAVLREPKLHMTQHKIGHSSIETMKDAVDEILAVLKDENLNDRQRKAEIDALLGLEPLTDDEFNTMTVLASCLTDYGIAKDEMQQKGQQQASGKEDQ